MVILGEVDPEEAVFEGVADIDGELFLRLLFDLELFQPGEAVLDFFEAEVSGERLGIHWVIIPFIV